MKSRMNHIRKAPIIDLLSQVSLPKNIISFGQGIPFFGPPTESIHATVASFFQPEGYQYSADNGRKELRGIIAEKLMREQQVSVHPDQIMVTSGANQAFMNAILSISQTNDEIIFFTPTYFNYIMAVELAGCKPVLVSTTESFQPNIEQLKEKISKKTKAIVSISPNNPTGAVYPSYLLKAINHLCQDHSLFHIADEVYEYYVYNNKEHKSPLIYDDSLSHTISIFSLSKTFAISGYRIGYMVFPKELYEDLLKAQDTIGICAPAPAQAAAIQLIPLGKLFCSQFFEVLYQNRKVVRSMLSQIDGLHTVWTNGAYYFFIILDSNRSSYSLVKNLIETYGILVLPGSMFDDQRCSFRLSYGNCSDEELLEGLKRLKYGLTNLL